MSRYEIAVGLLASVATVVVVALVGAREPARMALEARSLAARHIETGASVFDQYCSSCHGINASGGKGPPLDASSGLYGGDIGPGVAWRLQHLGWPVRQPEEFIYLVASGGRVVSTRPDEYPGDRTPDTPDAMAMPAWSQDYGGPLRPDQIKDIASYLGSFRSEIPANATPRPTTTQRAATATATAMPAAPPIATSAAATSESP
jgi:mono/diheme cytochrome c family protein